MATDGDYPALAVGKTGPLRERTIDLEEIYGQLRGKEHRLLLVMAEACNKVYVARRAPAGGNSVGTFSVQEDEGRHFRELFAEAKGDYIVSSSQRNQYSFLSAGQAGCFTGAFRDALAQFVATEYKDMATWEKVFNRTKQLTQRRAREIGQTQIPQWCKGECR